MIERDDSKGANEKRRLQALLENSRKVGGQPLEKRDVQQLCEAGHEDFSDAVFKNKTYISDVRISSLKGALVGDARFVRCDFRGTSFAGVDLGRTRFLGCDITGADFSASKIGGASIDFIVDKKTLPHATSLSVTPTMIESVTVCDDAEARFSAIFFDGKFNHEGNHYGEGIVLKSGGVVLGVLKQNREDSFLATRTVTDSEGNVVLWKGGIYQIHFPQLKQLEMLLAVKNKAAGLKMGGAWPVVDIDNFSQLSARMLSIESKDYGKAPAFKMNFVRFLQDTTMYEKLGQWTQALESSGNVVEFS